MGKKVEHPLDILREELQQTNVALKCAYDKFNYVTEPELIEASIYEISALKARYSYLLRCIKEQEPAARSGGRTAVPAAVAASAGKGGPVCPVERSAHCAWWGRFYCSPPCACSGGR